MSHRWASRAMLWLIPVALFAWAAFETYRAYLDHWEGSLRAPLIAGAVAGIAFVIAGTTIVTLQDRAEGGQARTER
ncbi:hypothetical protein P12x_003739 [Tundrisphaera lichenicola]|uniref:hypothetical protein n=1 Tax=Tundrisphaera lichenicola TaxID=2029860 RepID=UPI003EB82A2B